MKITKAVADNLRYASKNNERQVVWDSELRGFGIRVYPSGVKSFVLSYRSGGAKRFLALGRYGILTVDQARKLAIAHLGQIVQGQDPLKQRIEQRRAISIRDLLEIYLERHAKVYKKSWKEDERRIRAHLLPAFGARKVTDLTPGDAIKLHQEIGKRSIYEANRTFEVLRGAIEKAKSWDLIEANTLNPAARLKRFREKKRDRWLTPEEMPRLATAINTESCIYVRSAIWLYLLTGVRKSELLTAKWDQINWERAELRLEDTKSGNTHYVPLSGRAIAVLKQIPRVEGNPFIIIGKRKGQHLVGIARPWMRIRTIAGVSDVRLHDLRRTVGSWLAQGGASLHLIGRVLNHSSTETTKIYARFGQQAVRDALNAHGEKIASTANIETETCEFAPVVGVDKFNESNRNANSKKTFSGEA